MDQSMRRSFLAMFTACALFTAGCAGMNADARKILQEPVSCAGASQDLPALEASRPSGGERFLQGLQAIMPPMIVLSLLRDIFIGEPYRSVYLDHWRVAFGSYNRKIDTRVAELDSCGG